jgi:hypothetical protein
MSDWRQRTSVKFRSKRLVLSTDFREPQALADFSDRLSVEFIFKSLSPLLTA